MAAESLVKMAASNDSAQSARSAHEAHVTGLSGCQWYEVLLAIYPLLPSVLLTNRLAFMAGWSYTSSQRWWQRCRVLVLEMVVCVLPVVAVLTVLHHHLVTVAVTVTCLAVAASAASHPYTGKVDRRSVVSGKATNSSSSSSLTLVRSLVGLGTAIAILAVDFHVFPRRFAKTEQFGFSVMDVGAAAFLLINAVVDARPTAIFSLGRIVRGVLVLLGLGAARLLSLRATDYHQHHSEYGLHSNFFFVLAITKVLCLPLCRLLSRPLLWLGACSLTILQLLNTDRQAAWVMADIPRDTLLSANRESVVGLPGYTALYCWGALFGNFLFSHNHSVGGRPGAAAAPRVLTVCGAAGAGAGLLLLGLCWGLGRQPSRRLVNAEFIVWMVFLLLLLMFLSSLLEAYLAHVGSACVVPLLLQAINQHQLLFFLSSNLMTGAINLTVDTLLVTAPLDTAFITGYTIALCAGAALLHRRPTHTKSR